MIPQWIIEKKRDGLPLDDDEIREFIRDYTEGSIPDYQMAALAMAIYFKGLDEREVGTLTDAMMRSGDLIDTSPLQRPTADKHSTGGIGDKVSLILAPLAACCGLDVPMLSGRGLGITGGTLDKLESIPGYNTALTTQEFIHVIQQCGCAITGQTGSLAPADKKLYALRDVTGTVPSIPLISASIMSKKLAEGTANLVLDVKCGAGAFMKTPEDAEALASVMVNIGTRMGRGMAALITDMNEPLGHAVGNTLEVMETLQCLKGEGPADLMEITLALTAEMLILGGICQNTDEAYPLMNQAISNGDALNRFKQMVALQGGDTAVLDNPALLTAAPITQSVDSRENGYIQSVNAEIIGKVCLELGAGRKQTTDTINHAVGISNLVKIGSKICAGDPLMTIHAKSQADADQAAQAALTAIAISSSPVKPPRQILKRIASERIADHD